MIPTNELLELFVRISVKNDYSRQLRDAEAQGAKTERSLAGVGDGAERGAKKAEGALGRVGRAFSRVRADASKGAEFEVKADASPLERVGNVLRKTGAEVQKLSGKTVSLKARLDGEAQVRTGLEAMARRAESLESGQIRLSASLSGSQAVLSQLSQIEGLETRVDGDTVTVTANFRGGAEAAAQIERLSSVASSLDGDSIRMEANVTGASESIAELSALDNRARAVDGKTVRINADASGLVGARSAMDQAAQGIQRLLSYATLAGTTIGPVLIAGIGGAIPVAGALLGAVLALAAGLGQGLVGGAVAGVGAVALLGGAFAAVAGPAAMLKTKLDDYKTGLSGAQSAQQSAASSAQQYADANQRVDQAVEQRGQVEQRVAQQIGDAWKNYQRTQEQTEQTAIQVQQANSDAADELASARRDLDAATEEVASKQRDFNQALSDEPRNQAYSELDLADARDRLSDATKQYNEDVAKYGANSEQATDSLRAMQRAELDLDRQQEETRRTQTQGSQELRSAYDGLASAQDQRVSAADAVRKAEQNADRVAAQGAQQMKQARQAESDAFDAYQRARTDGQAQIKAAQDAVNQAEIAAARAADAMALANQNAADKTTVLTAAQQALYDRWQLFKEQANAAFTPAMDALSGLGVSVLNFGALFLGTFGQTSLLAVQALATAFYGFRAQMLQPIPMQALSSVLAALPGVVGLASQAAGQLAIALLTAFSLSLPFALDLLGAVAGLITRVYEYTQSAAGMASISGFFADSYNRAVELAGAVWNVVVGFAGVFRALDQAGVIDAVMGGLFGLTAAFRGMTAEGSAGAGRLTQFFSNMRPVLSAIWDLAGAVVDQVLRVTEALSTPGNVSVLVDIINAAKDALGPLGDLLISTFQGIGPELDDLLRGLAGLAETFAGSTPALEIFLSNLNWALDVFNGLPKPVKDTAANLAAYSSLFQMLGGPSLVAFVTGLLGMVSNMVILNAVAPGATARLWAFLGPIAALAAIGAVAIAIYLNFDSEAAKKAKDKAKAEGKTAAQQYGDAFFAGLKGVPILGPVVSAFDDFAQKLKPGGPYNGIVRDWIYRQFGFEPPKMTLLDSVGNWTKKFLPGGEYDGILGDWLERETGIAPGNGLLDWVGDELKKFEPGGAYDGVVRNWIYRQFGFTPPKASFLDSIGNWTKKFLPGGEYDGILGRWLSRQWQGLGDFGARLRQRIGQGLDTALAAVGPWAARWRQRISQGLTAAVAAVQQWAARWRQRISLALNTAVTAVAQWASRWRQRISLALNAALTAIQQWAARWRQRIATALNTGVTAVSQWASRWRQRITTALNAALTAVQQWAARWRQRVGAALNAAISAVQAWAARWRQRISLALNAAVAAVQQWAARWRQRIAAGLNAAVTAAQQWAARWRERITQALTAAVTAVQQWATRWRERITTALNAAITAVSQWATRWRQRISEALTQTLQAFQQRLAEIGRIVVQKFDEYRTAASERLSQLYQNAVERWDQLKDATLSALTTARDYVVSKLTEARDRAGEILTGLKDRAISVYDSLKSGTQSAFSAIGDAMWKPIDAAGRKLQEIWNGIIDGVAKVIGAVGLDDLAKDLQGAKFAEGGVASETPARAFAAGGLSGPRQPRIHMWGEGDYDEGFITVDPRYRRENIGYLKTMAAKLGQMVVPVGQRGGDGGGGGFFEAMRRRGARSRAFAVGGLSPEAIGAMKSRGEEALGASYVYGPTGTHAGPDGYSCSGLWNWILGGSHAETGMGTYAYHAGQMGLQPGPGQVEIGVDITGWAGDGTHMAGDIENTTFESTIPAGVHHGLGAGAFGSVYHLGDPKDFATMGNGGGGGLLSAAFEAAWNQFVQPLVDAGKEAVEGISGHVLVKATAGLLQKAADGVKGWISEAVGAAGGGEWNGGGDLDKWISDGIKAGTVFQDDPQTHAAIRGRAMQESGGDPNAINDWDVNAMNGTPSKGLLQLIEGTWEANRASPGADMGSFAENWMNPVKSVAVGTRYMQAAYGGPVGSTGIGYSEGGFITRDHIAAIHRNEVVLPLDNAKVQGDVRASLGFDRLEARIAGLETALVDKLDDVNLSDDTNRRQVEVFDHVSRSHVTGEVGRQAHRQHASRLAVVGRIGGGKR